MNSRCFLFVLALRLLHQLRVACEPLGYLLRIVLCKAVALLVVNEGVFLDFLIEVYCRRLFFEGRKLLSVADLRQNNRYLLFRTIVLISMKQKH